MGSAATFMPREPHITDSGIRTSRRVVADQNGLMDPSTTAPTKMASATARVSSSGLMAVIIMVSGVIIKCTEPASSDGPTVACTQATTQMTKSTDREYTLGLMVADTKVNSTKAASTARAYTGSQMAKKYTASGTWARRCKCSAMSRTS